MYLFCFYLDQDNQKKTPDNPHQQNNMNCNNNQNQQQQQQYQQQYGGHPGTGGGGSGNNVMLSELPEPPIPVSEIGPIPPPPMFSTPSPTMIAGRPHGPAVMHSQSGMMNIGHRDMNDYDYDGEFKT